MQHTSRKGPRAACSQPSWFERDDLHLRDERVERPSFVGVGQKSSCRISYTAAAAPRRRAFFMGRVLKDFAARKNRLCEVDCASFSGRLICSFSSLTAPARPLPPRTRGHCRGVDGAGAATVRRAALPSSKLASCLNFAAVQIQLLARINSSRRENRCKMSPDVPP